MQEYLSDQNEVTIGETGGSKPSLDVDFVGEKWLYLWDLQALCELRVYSLQSVRIA